MRTAARYVFFLTLLALCFGVGFSWRDLRSGELPPATTLKALLHGGAVQDDQSADDVFKLAYNRVATDYYKPVIAKQLKYAGMAGMMSALGDPHTLFLPPPAAKEFDQDTQGNFVGVGARLSKDPLGAKVATVFEDGPAAKQGMKAGDVITAVDGKSVVGMQVDDIVTRIRGQEGTNVSLTLIRPKQEKRKVINVRRATIIMPTVESKYLKDSGVGYMSVTQFSEITTDQFNTELDKLGKYPLKGLVIDLRGNPGGLLETAVMMLSRFVDNKLVVTMRMKDGHEEYAKTLSGLTCGLQCPIAILIDKDSASAAEIFAGVMQSYPQITRASLVGETSYGKASVQNLFKLRDGSSAKITIARYYLPGGKDIGRKVDADGLYVSGGLEPDFAATLDQDNASIIIGDEKTDTQLQAALTVIKAQNAGR